MISLFLSTVILGLTAQAEVLSKNENAEVFLILADRSLSCFAKDEDGDGLREYASVTLHLENLAWSPVVLHSGARVISFRQNGAEICRLVSDLLDAADPGHPGAGPYLHGVGSSVLSREGDTLQEKVSLTFPVAGSPEKKLKLEFETEQRLKQP